jgi:Mn-containing catalase
MLPRSLRKLLLNVSFLLVRDIFHQLAYAALESFTKPTDDCEVRPCHQVSPVLADYISPNSGFLGEPVIRPPSGF